MRVTAIIHLDNLRHNLGLIRKIIGPNVRICAAVKADGYGHGAVEIARALVREGVTCLGVAAPSEGQELREAGITCPVIVYSLPVREELETVIRHDLTACVADKDLAALYNATAAAFKKRVSVHLKVDTGMGRIGCRPSDAADTAVAIAGSEWLKLAGTFTHFPVSDARNPGPTLMQNDLFLRTLEDIRERGIDPGTVHAANSGGILCCPQTHHHMVRPGILLYGYYPSKEQERKLDFRPVMELTTQVVYIKKARPGETVSYGMTHTVTKETHIATIAAGYGDGYSRLLSGKAEVLIRGKRYPAVGRICMDQCMVDVGTKPDVQIYDKAVLFGPDTAGPGAEELADIMGTIPYETTCGISRRVTRIYTG